MKGWVHIKDVVVALKGRARLPEQYLPVNRDQGVLGMPVIDR